MGLSAERPPNTIRWNAGHLYIAAEFLMFKADKKYAIQYPEWSKFFAPGTRPSDWKTDHPAIEKLVSALEEQRDRIPAHFLDILDLASEAFVPYNMNTVDPLGSFIFYHEVVTLESLRL